MCIFDDSFFERFTVNIMYDEIRVFDVENARVRGKIARLWYMQQRI